MKDNKTILFAAPTNFGFSDAIKDELEKLGYTIFDLSKITHQPFQYKNILQRLHNCYRKTIFQDYEFKNILRAQAQENHLNSLVNILPNCKYGLFIRPDFYPRSFISKLKCKVDSLIAYQWDGFNRFPEAKDYIELFDKFFIFDRDDLAENTLPTTNFFIDYPQISKQNSDHNDAYFIGSYERERMPHIIKLKDILNANNIKDNIILFTKNDHNNKAEIKRHGIPYIEKYLSYKENLANTINSAILIDIHNPVHNGLSFRTFESLGYNKKLITTNETVKKYDFYNPNNIFIWNDKNTDEIVDFLSIPYDPVHPELKKKYVFNNWIKYILDQKDHIPILLPH